MPYVRVDVSRNLLEVIKGDATLQAINNAVVDGLKVTISKVKTVVTASEDFLVGDGSAEAHAYITVQCFKGRAVEVRGRLSKKLYELLNTRLTPKNGSFNTSVYICEIDAEATSTAYNEPKVA